MDFAFRAVPYQSGRAGVRGIRAGARTMVNTTPTPMDAAFEAAEAAAARGEVPVGAALVIGGAIVATSGNRMRELSDPTAHAEILAIRAACAATGTDRLPEADLYVTLEPCTMCAAAISFARIRRLYYGAPDTKAGAVDHGVRFFASPACHHVPDVYSGIGEDRAGALMKRFFRERR